jgi:Tol biopolymer transport system component
MSKHRSFVVSEPRLIHRGGDRPSFGPKGDAVVFHVQSKEGISLWIVDSDGYDPRLLYPPAGTQNPDASRPDWSWSETIAFSNRGEIWTIRPDGTDAKPYFRGTLPLTGATEVVMTYPSWYQDLRSIVAVCYYLDAKGTQQAVLFKLTPDSAEQLTVSPNPCAGRPSVNPDGTKIAFAGNAGSYSQEQNQIWVVEPPPPVPPRPPYRLEPGNPARFQGRSPNWSPFGDLIVFESTRPDPHPTTKTPLGIWLMQSDGTKPQRLTPRGVHAEWNRQQTQIVFAKASGLYILDYAPVTG